jgi:hypothetical protein
MCAVPGSAPVFLGTFTAPATNEEGSLVGAALYYVELVGPIVAASEIEEILWLDPMPPHAAELAPLRRDSVLPPALNFIRARD